MKRHLVTLLKIVLSLGIVAALAYYAARGNAFANLEARFRDPGFNWWLLTSATLVTGFGIVLTLIRWWLLVRALDMPFKLREALRIGFLGFLFNLAPMGIVGGDLIKAVLLSRQVPGRRTRAFASVIVDRVLGLYILFVVASVMAVVTGFLQNPDLKVRTIAWAALAITAASTIAFAALLIAGITHGTAARRLAARAPYVGAMLVQTIEALGMYRRNLGVLAISAIMTVGVHCSIAIGVWLITLGIYGPKDVGSMDILTQFVVSPLAMAAQVIPINLGPTEGALEYLYVTVYGMKVGQGFVVSLGYRFVTLLVALVGVAYYLASRQELNAVIEEAEQIEEGDAIGKDGPDPAVERRAIAEA